MATRPRFTSSRRRAISSFQAAWTSAAGSSGPWSTEGSAKLL
ncbi:hypothetical protein DSM3645_02818 [Blastopirellula marina DSM 3645]|uniref:Uncharacterized protein n=1 Tax=Blastopirellula marina DSM 3645 TaxID=314230 RepID=A3ZVM7_9BACT|nr:hypothetical protein DSM3645_02818 [Blastopirellula marina DSM 3645]